MRYLLLPLLAFTLHGAEPKPLPREDIVLTDGRKITGTYDEAAQTLILDGGKNSLHVAPEQIAERGPAKPPRVSVADPGTKKMTPEEKLAAVAGFKEREKQSAVDSLIAEADKADRESTEYTKKSAAYRVKANQVALSFQERARQEGEDYSIDKILREEIITRKTHANNRELLGLLSLAQRCDQDAIAKQSVAAAKRAEAERLRSAP